MDSYDGTGRVNLHEGSQRNNIANSVPVISSFGFNVPNIIKKIDGRTNTTNYLEFLKTVVSPVADNNFSTYSPMMFVHDYYPVHTSNAVQSWLRSKENIVLHEWPRSFGDVLPIECVWKLMIEKMSERQVRILSNEDLWREIQTTWSLVTTDDYVVESIENIPNQLQAIVNNNGEWTDV